MFCYWDVIKTDERYVVQLNIPYLDYYIVEYVNYFVVQIRRVIY